MAANSFSTTSLIRLSSPAAPGAAAGHVPAASVSAAAAVVTPPPYTTDNSDLKRSAEGQCWEFATFRIGDFTPDYSLPSRDTREYDRTSLCGATHHITFDGSNSMAPFDDADLLRCIATIQAMKLQIQLNLNLDIPRLPPPESAFGKLLRHPQVRALVLVTIADDEEEDLRRYNKTMTEILTIASSEPANPGHLNTLVVKGPASGEVCETALCALIQKNAQSLQHFELSPTAGLPHDLVEINIRGTRLPVNIFSKLSLALLKCKALNTLNIIAEPEGDTNYIPNLGEVLKGLTRLKSLTLEGILCLDAKLLSALQDNSLEDLDIFKFVGTTLDDQAHLAYQGLFAGLGRHPSLRRFVAPINITPDAMSQFMKTRIGCSTSSLGEVRFSFNHDVTIQSVVERLSRSTLGSTHGLPFHTLRFDVGCVLPDSVMFAILHIMSTSSRLQTLSLRHLDGNDINHFYLNDSEENNLTKFLVECLRANARSYGNLVRLDLGIEASSNISVETINKLESAILANPTLKFITPQRGGERRYNDAIRKFIPQKPEPVDPWIMEHTKRICDHLSGNRWRPVAAILAGRKNPTTEIGKWLKRTEIKVLPLIFSFLPGWPTRTKRHTTDPVGFRPPLTTAFSSSSAPAIAIAVDKFRTGGSAAAAGESSVFVAPAAATAASEPTVAIVRVVPAAAAAAGSAAGESSVDSGEDNNAVQDSEGRPSKRARSND